ncbi:hypothetical protein ACFV1N_13485 [Streptosporangium canum]|uniref:hypothetical protein n=1 Tax=Streptosporangium canum TaxID=324952 RepID=UPI0036B9B7D5
MIIVVDRAAGRADDVGLSCAAWPLAAVSSSDRGSARGSGLAEQIMKQALSFLAACAARPYARLAPSELVDIGWHTFILYTREYAELLLRAGRQPVHQPRPRRRPQHPRPGRVQRGGHRLRRPRRSTSVSASLGRCTA